MVIKTNIGVHTFTAPCYPGQKAYLIREALSKTPWDKQVKIEETVIEQVIFTEKGTKVKFACNSTYQTSINNLGKSWCLSEEEANRIFQETMQRAKP